MSGLRLVPATTFVGTVYLTVPGEPKRVPLTFVFAHKTRADLNQWAQNPDKRPDSEFLGDVVRDWKVGPVDEHGKPVPFTPEAFAALLNAYPASGDEIFTGYLAAYREAKAGN